MQYHLLACGYDGTGASGLQAALEELRISAHNTVGIGDAENDHAFLALCGCSAAVANAFPTLEERVDYVTASDHGARMVSSSTGLSPPTWRARARLTRGVCMGAGEPASPVDQLDAGGDG